MTGLTEGLHGIHIHTDGDVSTGCSAAGGHYNPKGVDHGARTAKVRHVGDFGNIYAGADGKAEMSFTDSYIMLYGDDSNIMNRGCMIHGG